MAAANAAEDPLGGTQDQEQATTDHRASDEEEEATAPAMQIREDVTEQMSQEEREATRTITQKCRDRIEKTETGVEDHTEEVKVRQIQAGMMREPTRRTTRRRHGK